MSNHPNMSYCMFHNTNLAMQQINNAIEEGDNEDYDSDEAPTDKTEKTFFEKLRCDEQQAFKALIQQCQTFIDYCEQEGLL